MNYGIVRHWALNLIVRYVVFDNLHSLRGDLNESVPCIIYGGPRFTLSQTLCNQIARDQGTLCFFNAQDGRDFCAVLLSGILIEPK